MKEKNKTKLGHPRSLRSQDGTSARGDKERIIRVQTIVSIRIIRTYTINADFVDVPGGVTTSSSVVPPPTSITSP